MKEGKDELVNDVFGLAREQLQALVSKERYFDLSISHFFAFMKPDHHPSHGVPNTVYGHFEESTGVIVEPTLYIGLVVAIQ